MNWLVRRIGKIGGPFALHAVGGGSDEVRLGDFGVPAAPVRVVGDGVVGVAFFAGTLRLASRRPDVASGSSRMASV